METDIRYTALIMYGLREKYSQPIFMKNFPKNLFVRRLGPGKAQPQATLANFCVSKAVVLLTVGQLRLTISSPSS